MDKRQAATAARKEQITRTAVTLLAERGYRATTFEAICTEAGLSSKRLITYHFSGKDELLAAVADQIVADSERYMLAALDGVTGARELLAAVIRANVRFIADHPQEVEALRQILLNGGLGDYEHHDVDSRHRLARLLEEGRRTGVFRPFDVRVMAAALRASIDGVAPLIAGGMDPGLCADELVEHFDRSTRADKAER
ncbi:TetR/AcrR family transcriptional regulator [Nonomuraea sp. NPDC049419]|uniref:TetR/AcrR family transcriptional regulator n=1 Tax=Nonomuraea sp. NPDC049419 TaxID=3155772 RepID=UPI00343098E7